MLLVVVAVVHHSAVQYIIRCGAFFCGVTKRIRTEELVTKELSRTRSFAGGLPAVRRYYLSGGRRGDVKADRICLQRGSVGWWGSGLCDLLG